MAMRLFFFSALAILLSCSTANTQSNNSTAAVAAKVIPQDGINGAWQLTMSTPRGKRKIDFTIEKATKIAATGKDKNGNFAIVIDGNKLRFSREMSTRMGNMTTNFSGKIDNDNQLSGIMTMESGPAAGKNLDWVAVRQ